MDPNGQQILKALADHLTEIRSCCSSQSHHQSAIVSEYLIELLHGHGGRVHTSHAVDCSHGAHCVSCICSTTRRLRYRLTPTTIWTIAAWSVSSCGSNFEWEKVGKQKQRAIAVTGYKIYKAILSITQKMETRRQMKPLETFKSELPKRENGSPSRSN